MKNKVTVILILVIFECHGHDHILGDILSNAHKGVEGVAGAVLGGLKLFGRNRQNRPQDVPQKGPEETIIVVVEEPDSGDYGNNHEPMHHHRPPHHHHGRPPPPPHRPPFDDSPPGPHHHGRPPFSNDPPPRPPGPPPHSHGRPPFNNDLPAPPPHHQRPQDDPRPGDNIQNQGTYHDNEYGNNGNNFNGNNVNGHPYDNNNGNSNNNGYQSNNKGSQDGQEKNYYEKPTTEHIKIPDPTKSSQLPKQDENNKATEKPSDRPLYIPLNPNEYIYGGDKINITAPKRDADRTEAEESDDDDFNIDIRLKNE